MMKIIVNKNANGLVKYFTTSLTKDDYYFDQKSIPGRFHGNLKKDFNLSDKVSHKIFSKLAHGINPKTGKSLTPRKVKNANSSYEVTFSAPKSVSLIMMLSDEQTKKDILQAHRFAVNKAMESIEHDAMVQTRIEGRKMNVRSGSLLFARFDHLTSRPVVDENLSDKSYVSDMNLHSHNIIFNVSQYQGKYLALKANLIFQNSAYHKEIYHSTLSKRLQDIGFEIERGRESWEIKSIGLTRRTLLKFSNRLLQVEKLAKELGITSASGKSKIAAGSRSRKSAMRQDINLRKVWDDRLTAIERKAIKNARKAEQGKGNPSALSITAERAIEKALSKCLERQSTAPVKRVLAEGLKLTYGKYTVKDLEETLEKRDDLIGARKFYTDHITTKEHIHLEKKMVRICAQSKNKIRALNPHYKIKREFLNEDQRQAITALVNTTDQVSLLTGKAGTGKTSLLLELQTATHEAGKDLIALAPSSVASRDVMVKEGFKNANTIASFLNDRKAHARCQDQVLLIDEAGMVGTKTFVKVLDIAKKHNLKVILSADPQQHKSPEAGAPIQLLLEHARLKPIRVEKILRQKNNPEYKRAVQCLSDGRPRLGFKILNEMGAVHAEPDTQKRHEIIAKAYTDALRNKRSVLVVSPTHAEGMMINEQIRKTLKLHDRIQNKDHRYIMNIPLNLTTAEKQDFAQYEQGQMIQFFRNTTGFKAGDKYMVKGRNHLNQVIIADPKTGQETMLRLEHTDRFALYRQDEIILSQGDKIRLTQNGKTKEKKLRVYNGQEFSIKSFGKNGDIQLSNGKILGRDFGHFRYGYTSTSHASQGKTVDEILIAQSALSFPASNAKQFYVSCSRGRHGLQIFTDDKDELRKAIDRSGNPMHAKELEDLHKEQLQRAQLKYYMDSFKTQNYEPERRQHTPNYIPPEHPSRDEYERDI